MNIIALDFDDCIIDWHMQSYELNPALIIEQLKLNLIKLEALRKKIDGKYFITSSWGVLLKLNQNGYIEKHPEHHEAFADDSIETEAIDTIIRYLGNNVIGICKGDREICIKGLLLKGHKVVAFDDMDLDKIKHQNYKYVPMYGAVSMMVLDSVATWFRR